MAKEKQPLMTEEFWAWFDAVQRERDLSDSAVASLADIERSVISKARNGKGTIGAESLTKIADGLGFPRTVLLRLGGWIPRDEGLEFSRWEAQSLWDELSEDDQDEITALMKIKVQNARRQKRGKPKED